MFLMSADLSPRHHASYPSLFGGGRGRKHVILCWGLVFRVYMAYLVTRPERVNISPQLPTGRSNPDEEYQSQPRTANELLERRRSWLVSTIASLFGISVMSNSKDLNVPLRVRVDPEMLKELDALEAFLRGHGFRDASRSSLVRAAVTSYLDGVRAEAPEALIPPTNQFAKTGS